jgi:hypothetical protein
MELLAQILNQFSWPIVIILCLTLGLAPFFSRAAYLGKAEDAGLGHAVEADRYL